MGVFKKKKSTIGYKYFLGMHLVLCHGTLDSLNQIFVDGDKSLWVGRVDKSDTIKINKPDIFGGNSSEGGVSGELDVIWGSRNEPKNQYLQDNIGAIPNFRGVVSVVLKQMYLGNSSYIKRWSFKATRTRTFDNWYPSKGAIGGEGTPLDVSAGGKVVIIVDLSYSMAQGYERMKSFTEYLLSYVRSLVENGGNYEFATYRVADFGRVLGAHSYKLLDGSTVEFSNLSPDGRQNPSLHVVDWEDPLTWYTFGYDSGAKFRFPKPEFEYDPASDSYQFKQMYADQKYPAGGLAYIPEPLNGFGAEFWKYGSSEYYMYRTSWSEVDNRYVGHGLNTKYSRINYGTWNSLVNESFMVSPNAISTFLDLSVAENKIVVIFSDRNSERGLRYDDSMFMPQSFVENGTWNPTINTFDTRYANIPESDTFYRGLFESAGHFRKHGILTKDVCSYEKRNLIKCMNVLVTKETEQEIFPWTSPPTPAHLHDRSAPSSPQTMGTMPYDYFGEDVPVLDSASGANAEILFENFKKLLRWEYDSPDPHGEGFRDGTYNADMGPAHIIRECLTNPIWGMGYPADDIDDFSFKRAADVFFDEKLGISLLLDKESTVEEFIKEVLRHVDAVLYIDRRTGLFCLKPVRDDYNVDGLLVLDESNIISMSDYSKPTLGELTNSITVNAWDKKTNTTLSVTVQNAALAMVQGREIGTKIQYPGITNRENALRLAQRDLRTYSTALVRCTLEVNDVAKDLTIGGVFAFSWADYDIVKLPMRIVGIDYGTDRKHSVRITCVQDVFYTPTQTIVRYVDPTWENPTQVPPGFISQPIAIETPYYELCAQVGQAQVDSNLATNPDIGLGLVSAIEPPNAATGYAFTKDDYGTPTEVGNFSFAPFAQVYELIPLTVASGSLMEDSIILTISDADALNLRVNDWLLIDNEIMAVKNYPGTGIGYEIGPHEWLIHVKRGCFDTQPGTHLPGATAYFMSNANVLDLTEMSSGESQGYYMHSINSMGQSLDTVTSARFNHRAIRPYPPHGVEINGYYYNERILERISLMWYHRNRKLQAGGEIFGFDEWSFTSPEPGVTYKIELINNDDNSVIYSIDGLSGPDFEIPAENIPFELENVNLRLSSIRDGYTCLYPYEQRIYLAAPVGGNLEFKLDVPKPNIPGDELEFTLD
jgi:hypothetical protein